MESFSDQELKTILTKLWDEGLEGMCIVDTNGMFLHANPAFCDAIGYTEAELKQTTYKEITHPADLKFDVEMAAAIKTGDIHKYRIWKRYIHKRGHSVWALLKVLAIKEDTNFKFYIAQTIPAYLVDTPRTNGGGLYKPVRPTIEIGLKAFLKQNWKWVLATIGVVLGFIIKREIEWARIIEKVNNLTN